MMRTVCCSRDAFTHSLSLLLQCSHCQKLAPIWERLEQDWENHSQGMIAEVDCSDKLNEDWCSDEMEILGLPTIRYGDTSFGGIFLENWSGDREYEALSALAKDVLSRPACSPGSWEGCDGPMRAQMKGMWKLSLSEIERRIESNENQIAQTEQAFQKQFDEMQKVYDQRAQDHEMLVARIKQNIKILRAAKEFQTTST